MSFFKALFGRSSTPEAPQEAPSLEHKGFLIKAKPFKADGQYQLAGTIEKEVEGTLKEASFIRVDRFPALEDAVQFTLSKGRQIVDEQGERMFK